MKCPYNRKRETQVLQWTQDPFDDNDALLKGGEQITTTSFELMDCVKEECGAYYDGRCCYSGGNFDNE